MECPQGCLAPNGTNLTSRSETAQILPVQHWVKGGFTSFVNCIQLRAHATSDQSKYLLVEFKWKRVLGEFEKVGG
mgnify:CR=1 FL=1